MSSEEPQITLGGLPDRGLLPHHTQVAGAIGSRVPSDRVAKELPPELVSFALLASPEEDPHVSLRPQLSWIDHLGTGGAETFAPQLTLESAQTSPSQRPPTDPRFEIIGLIARGGFGDVLLAHQHSLKRRVAVKRLRVVSHDRDLEAEFRNEALITAHLEHPNIVPVYDMARDGASNSDVFAMKYVRGRPWSDILAEEFRELDAESFLARHLPIMLAMMQGVAFAHARGIVHRDIKPSQVMVGEFGEVVLMDWGLALYLGEEKNPPDAKPATPQAKGTNGDSAITRSWRPAAPNEEQTPAPTPCDSVDANAWLRQLPTPVTALNPAGTPCLLAPEQLEMRATRISRRTDIFLLGGTLYYLLTGTFPYHAPRSTEALIQARLGEIDAPAERAPNRYVPRELATLAMEAMAWNPADRIGSVSEFITRIQEYLSGSAQRRESEQFVQQSEAILGEIASLTPASPTSVYDRCTAGLELLGRAQELWPRHPRLPEVSDRLVAHYADAALNSGDLRLAGILLVRIHDTNQRARLSGRLIEAETRERRNRLTRHAAVALSILAIVGLIFVLWKRNVEQQQASESLMHERDRANRSRALAERAQKAAELEQYFTLIHVAGSHVRFGEPHKATDILLGRLPGNARQFEWGRLLHQSFTSHMMLQQVEAATMLMDATFSPDETRIVTSDASGVVTLWDAATGAQLRSAPIHQRAIWSVEFSPDGSTIATASYDGSVALLDPQSLKEQMRIVGHQGLLRRLRFTPDGTRIITGGPEDNAKVWSVATGDLLFTMPGPHRTHRDTDFHPIRPLIAKAADHIAELRDAETYEILREWPHPEVVMSVDFSPDGQRLLTACTDRRARIFSVETGEMLLELNNQTAWLMMATFHPSGQIFATSDNAGDIRLWDANTGALLRSFNDGPQAYKVKFNHDGTRLLTTTNSTVQIWNAETPPAPPQPEPVLSWERAANEVITGTNIRISCELRRQSRWHTPTGRSIIREDDGTVHAVDTSLASFSSDRTRAVLARRDTFEAALIDTATSTTLSRLHPDGVWVSRFSPDNRYVVTASPNGDVDLHDASNGRHLHMLLHGEEPDQLGSTLRPAGFAFLPDGPTVLISTRLGAVYLVEVESLSTITLREGGEPLVFAAVSPDGKMGATGGLSRNVTIWDLENRRELTNCRSEENYILDAIFSPDSQRLITISNDDRVRLWDPFIGRELITVFDLSGPEFLAGAAFTNDGRSILAVCSMRRFHRADTLPWDTTSYAEVLDAGMPLKAAVERYRRQQNTGLPITIDAVAHVVGRNVTSSLP